MVAAIPSLQALVGASTATITCSSSWFKPSRHPWNGSKAPREGAQRARMRSSYPSWPVLSTSGCK